MIGSQTLLFTGWGVHELRPAPAQSPWRPDCRVHYGGVCNHLAVVVPDLRFSVPSVCTISGSCPRLRACRRREARDERLVRHRPASALNVLSPRKIPSAFTVPTAVGLAPSSDLCLVRRSRGRPLEANDVRRAARSRAQQPRAGANMRVVWRHEERRRTEITRGRVCRPCGRTGGASFSGPNVRTTPG